MRLARNAFVALVLSILSFSISSRRDQTVMADPCQNPPSGTPQQYAENHPKNSTVVGNLYVYIDPQYFDATEIAAFQEGIEYWPQITTTYQVFFGQKPTNAAGRQINVVPAVIPTIARSIAINGEPGNIEVSLAYLIINSTATPKVSPLGTDYQKIWRFELAHEFGHHLGFADITSNALTMSVMSDTVITVNDIVNMTWGFKDGDMIAFHGKYHVRPDEPDNPCWEGDGGSGEEEESGEGSEGAWVCYRNRTVTNYYVTKYDENGDPYEELYDVKVEYTSWSCYYDNV